MVARGGNACWWRQVPKVGGERNCRYWGGGVVGFWWWVGVLVVGARCGGARCGGLWCFPLGGGLGWVVAIFPWWCGGLGGGVGWGVGGKGGGVGWLGVGVWVGWVFVVGLLG